MGNLGRVAIVAVLSCVLLTPSACGFYLPGVAPRDFKKVCIFPPFSGFQSAFRWIKGGSGALLCIVAVCGQYPVRECDFFSGSAHWRTFPCGSKPTVNVSAVTSEMLFEVLCTSTLTGCIWVLLLRSGLPGLLHNNLLSGSLSDSWFKFCVVHTPHKRFRHYALVSEVDSEDKDLSPIYSWDCFVVNCLFLSLL